MLNKKLKKFLAIEAQIWLSGMLLMAFAGASPFNTPVYIFLFGGWLMLNGTALVCGLFLYVNDIAFEENKMYELTGFKWFKQK